MTNGSHPKQKNQPHRSQPASKGPGTEGTKDETGKPSKPIKCETDTQR